MKKWIVCCIVALSAVVQAGLTVVTEDVSDATLTRMYIQGDHVRVDVNEGKDMSVYFDSSKMLFRMVNHAERTYIEMDKESIEKMAARLNQAMSQMETALKNVPPEQRAMLQGMLGGRMPGVEKQAPKVEFLQTKEKKTIKGYHCERYNQLSDGELTTEFWVASFDELKVSKADVRALHALTKTQQDLMASMKKSSMVSMANAGALAFEEMNGLPMVTKLYKAGQVVSETVIKDLSSGGIKATMFELPKGYQKKDAPSMFPPTKSKPARSRLPFKIPSF